MKAKIIKAKRLFTGNLYGPRANATARPPKAKGSGKKGAKKK